MDLAIFKTFQVSSTFEGRNTRSDEIHAETAEVFVKFRLSWHSSAHACTSSWLTNAVRDAPVASVKVVVSASCLRGKRPSASSKLLRYLESQPNQALSISGCFQSMLLIKPKSEVLHRSIPFLLERCEKSKSTHRKKRTYAIWKFVLFFALHPISFLMSPWLLSTRLIWGFRLSPDQFDVWINEETS